MDKYFIRTWRVWLILCILAGLAVVVILVINQSRVTESVPTGVRQKAEFPLGLYCVNSRVSRITFSNSVIHEFPAIAEAGFNFIQSYQFESANYDFDSWNTEQAAREYLDAAHQNGLKVLMGLAIGLHDETLEADLAFIRKRVPAIKDHPALFGWQLYDEPSTADPPIRAEHLKTAYDLIKEIDPDHPVSIAEAATVNATHPYTGSGGFDIVMPDNFSAIPIQETVSVRQDLARSAQYLATQGKYIINHIGVYNLAKDRMTCPPDQLGQWPVCINRYPTKDEIRFMAYDSIVLGAKGLSFLCYRFNYDEDDPGDDVGPVANPVQWARIRAVSQELREMGPILTAPDSSTAVSVDSSGVEIAILAKGYKGKLYIIATNPSPAETMVTFSLPKVPAAVTVFSESRSITPQGNSFQDTFAAYRVHIYEIGFTS